MTETTETVETEETENTEVEETEPVETEETQETEVDPAAGLKSALQKERQARKEAEKQAREMKRQIDDAGKSPDEKALDDARREALEEAQAGFNKRLVSAELKAALSGKVSNAALAMKVIDTSEIGVTSDGEVDMQSVDDAINSALAEYPELQPQDSRKFQGGADQGARGRQAQPAQLTDADLENMSPAQINKARREGRLDRLLGVS